MIKFLEKNKEFIRFIIVGILATIINYSIYLLLINLNLKHTLAYTIGYLLSFIFNFISSTYFTFKTTPSTKKGVKFCIAHITNYLMQIIFLNIGILIGLNENIVPIYVFIICVPINFVLVKCAFKK